MAEFSDFRGKTSLAKGNFLSLRVILICLSGTQALKFFYDIEERIPSIQRCDYAYVPSTSSGVSRVGYSKFLVS